MPDIILEAGTLPPPACYGTEQERLEAYVSSIIATLDGDLQWQSSVAAPIDFELYWRKVDSNGRDVAVLNWSVDDAAWVRWRSVPAIDGTPGGAPDAYTLTFDPPFSSGTVSQSGRQYIFIAPFTNAGPATINIDGNGAVAIVKFGATALAAGDIQSGQMVVLTMDGTKAHLQSPRVVPPEPQFLTYVSSLQAIPATGTTEIFAHGFLNGVTGIVPHMVQVSIVRTAASADTITFQNGTGSFTIQHGMALDHTQIWDGYIGEYFKPVFYVRWDAVNVYVTAHYPNGMAIPNYEDAIVGGYITQQITPTDYQIRVKATAINPDF